MATQDSTFTTAHVLDNEIIKASDFEFAFEQLVENVSKATQMLLESNQDFVINGKVIPATGMNVSVSPIYGVCKSTGKPFGRTETTDETIGFAGSTSGRVDIIEVQGDWETYDNQQRAFNDPDTDVQTYQYVDTKKLMKPVYRIKEGVEGSSVAPTVDAGWVKLAEVSIRAGVTVILESDIHNITADIAGLENEDWTTEKDITYNIGYISDINARFRVQHNEDGTHADDCINEDSLDIGTGTKQINANILPIGGSVTIPSQAAISSADSILSVITKAVNVITSLYNNYLKFGTYGFEGEIQISATDTGGVLNNPLKLSADGSGNATVKVGSTTVLTIDTNGKLHTNYTVVAADNANTIVNKAVTDAISTALSNLTTRVENLENTSDVTIYSNGTLSMGTDGRFNTDSVSIRVATTANITLSGTQTVDGQALVENDVVLVKDQTNKKENGIYTVSNSVWYRVTDYDSPEKIKGKIFFVSTGTTNGQRMFYVPKVNFNSSAAFGQDEIPVLEYMASHRAIPNRAIIRDANGRAQVAAPVAENDIARKAEITALYGNVVGTPLGTAAVGVATTFARSDHVHPLPTCVECSGYATSAGSATSAGYATSAGSATSSDTARYSTCSEYTKIQCVGYGSSWWYIPQAGQPTYVWGTNTGVDMFIWDPTSFSVGYSNTSGAACNANCLGGYSGSWYATGNTYALRDANGNLNMNYYNTTAPAEDFMSYDTGTGAWIAFVDASGWIRRAHPSTTYAGFAQKMNYSTPQGSAASNAVYLNGATLVNNTAEPILFFGRWAAAAVQYLPPYGSVGVATSNPTEIGFIRIR